MANIQSLLTKKKIILEEITQLASDGRQVYLYKDKTGKASLFILQSYELFIAAQQSVQPTLLMSRPETVATKQNILAALEAIKKSQSG